MHVKGLYGARKLKPSFEQVRKGCNAVISEKDRTYDNTFYKVTRNLPIQRKTQLEDQLHQVAAPKNKL